MACKVLALPRMRCSHERQCKLPIAVQCTNIYHSNPRHLMSFPDSEQVHTHAGSDSLRAASALTLSLLHCNREAPTETQKKENGRSLCSLGPRADSFLPSFERNARDAPRAACDLMSIKLSTAPCPSCSVRVRLVPRTEIVATLTMQSRSTTLSSVRYSCPRLRPVTFRESRSPHNGFRHVQTKAQGSIDGTGLAVLSQRIQQLKATETRHQWPGYEQWRQSNESPWSGFGEWRTRSKAREEHMRNSLRQRMSKPSLIANEDVAEEGDHLDRMESLDTWHAACWKNLRDSDAFDK